MRASGEGELSVIRSNPDGSPGVAKTIRTMGTGAAVDVGQTVMVRFSAMLDDGRVVDAHVGRKLIVGMRQLHGIGADIGLATMKVGERCLLTCSPGFTYGDAGAPASNIPPGENITFDIQVVDSHTPGALRTLAPSLLGALLFMTGVASFFYWEFHR
mmetsp:Transcript_36113/g.77047  ORF Transcript_36113/g.77047 Transcript_36113/m.77047 type:complete len:157 (-) Transcript_36113:204-674(-)